MNIVNNQDHKINILTTTIHISNLENLPTIMGTTPIQVMEKSHMSMDMLSKLTVLKWEFSLS